MNDNNKSIINKYKLACNEVLHAFCQRHDMYAEDDPWVGGVAGGIAAVGDFFFDMQTIIYDITEEPPLDELLKWQDYCSRLCYIGIKKDINYESWCKGAPRMSEETISRLEKLKSTLEEEITKATENNEQAY